MDRQVGVAPTGRTDRNAKRERCSESGELRILRPKGRRVSEAFNHVPRCFLFPMNTHLVDLFHFPFPGKLVPLSQNLDCTRGRGQLRLVLPTISLPVGAAP